MNLVVRELPREHRVAGVLRRHVVPGVGVVKVEGTNLSSDIHKCKSNICSTGLLLPIPFMCLKNNSFHGCLD
jgi:hypothetical protein